MQAALDELGASHGPGVFALVADAGEVIFAASAGTADLRRPRPILSTDLFRIASVTKTFLATIMLQLVAERRLSLDDAVGHWLPGVVPGAWALAVGQLLTMRSGLPDYVPAVLGDPPDVARLQRYFEPAELIRIALQQPGRAEPGAAWRYSNTDYILLGLIAERAAGQPVQDLLRERIFTPLGLQATYLPLRDRHIDGPHARGYVRLTAAAGYSECTEFSPSECWAAGAIISTPPELASFLDALLGGRLLPPAQLAAMRAMRPAGSRGMEYGMGLARCCLPDGTALYGHGGTHFGVDCLAFRSDTGRTAVIYRNSWDRVTGGLSRSSRFLQAAFTKPAIQR